ncbi:beta family protein [Bacillus paralicheniformis]|uniref:beta family protein n=1 Tax=Bacillus paralicheniformis TaxID=1648923 RepID=UPI0011EE290B|nr:hypothetical protein [Bacillus paralicheniformis]KAA0834984.1 hypothetical protein EI977_19880 [Bacillus paralicheniformis]KAA0843771.1 hypothetical protein EI979_01150 [Bacillus paralicheniformis]MBZ5214454.1 hypothetical protein [Bacillus paralicheniformis]
MTIYFPILKNSSSEMSALENLKDETKQKVIPIIESKVINPKKVDEWWSTFKTLGSYFQKKINDMKFIYDFNSAFDKLGEALESLKSPHNKNLIEHCIEKLNEKNLNFIPCIHFDSPEWIISSVFKFRPTEIAVRVRCHDFNSAMEDLVIERIQDKIFSQNLKTNIYIILDFSNSPINEVRIKKSIHNFTKLEPQKLILALTNCPEDASGIKPVSFTAADQRLDYKTFQSFKKEHPKLLFGDYTVRLKGEPDNNSNINYYNTYLKIFYSTEDDYMIGKSSLLESDGIDTFISVCQEIIESDIFTKDLSFADKKIEECANKRFTINNHSKPIELGINHHIELTVKQLTGSPVLSSL